jgi:hypothetical protein
MNATAKLQPVEHAVPVHAANDKVFPPGARLRQTLDFTPVLARLHAASLKAVKASGVAAAEAPKRAMALVRTLWSWLYKIVARIFGRAGQQLQGHQEGGAGEATPPALSDDQAQGLAPTEVVAQALPGHEARQDVAIQAAAQEADALALLVEKQGPDLVMLEDELLGPDYLDGVARQLAGHASRYEAQAMALREQARAVTARIGQAQGVAPEVVEAMIAAGEDGGLLDRDKEVRQILEQATQAEVAALRTRAALEGLLKTAASKLALASKAQALAAELVSGLDVDSQPLASPVAEVMLGAKASAKRDLTAAAGVSSEDPAPIPEMGGVENTAAVMYDTKKYPGDFAGAGSDVGADVVASVPGQRTAGHDVDAKHGKSDLGERDDFPYAPRSSAFAALAMLNPIEQDDRPDISRDRY